jgi:hypothetical protein
VERLTWTPEDESDPAMARTAGGIVWLAYGRGGDVLYRTHQVSCWSNETTLPTGTSCGLPPSERPAVVEDADARIWIAYDSYRSYNGDVYAMRSNDSFVVTGLPEAAEGGDAPAAFSLSPCHPNPFMNGTTLRLALDAPQHAVVTVYDLAGRLVRTLVDAPFPAGEYRLTWDGADGSGRRVASGVYFVRADVGSHSGTRKMVFLRD